MVCFALPFVAHEQELLPQKPDLYIYVFLFCLPHRDLVCYDDSHDGDVLQIFSTSVDFSFTTIDV